MCCARTQLNQPSRHFESKKFNKLPRFNLRVQEISRIQKSTQQKRKEQHKLQKSHLITSQTVAAGSSMQFQVKIADSDIYCSEIKPFQNYCLVIYLQIMQLLETRPQSVTGPMAAIRSFGGSSAIKWLVIATETQHEKHFLNSDSQ